MFGSEILDVAIGLILVYFLLSLVCSAIREAVEGVLKRRAVYLERGIHELLGRDADGTPLATRLYNHPLVYGLFQGDYPAGKDTERTKDRSRFLGRDLPSYIPARNFAVALFDLAVGEAAPGGGDPGPALPFLSLTHAREQLSQKARSDGANAYRALRTIVDTSQYDPNRALAGIEAWYDSTMDRVSGWYKRETQWILLGLGLAATVLMNVNTLTIARYLYRDETARQAIVARAEAVGRDTTRQRANFDAVDQQLREMQLPIGWSDPRVVGELGTAPTLGEVSRYAATSLLGWLITTFAVSLGAPFWFDLLNKVMVIRSTVKPHEKSREEGSEDRQTHARAPEPSRGGGWSILPTGGVSAASSGDDPPGPGAEGRLH